MFQFYNIAQQTSHSQLGLAWWENCLQWDLIMIVLRIPIFQEVLLIILTSKLLPLALTKFLTITWMATYRYQNKNLFRGSQSQKRRCSVKKAVLRNFTKWNSQENTCARDSWPATLLKSPWHRWFPVNFVKFLRTSFLKQNRNTPALRQITSALLVFPLDLCSHSIMKIKHLADCCSEILTTLHSSSI